MNRTPEIPIEYIDLPLHPYNCLKRAGINTYEQLKSTTDKELLMLHQFGKMSLIHVKDTLAKFESSKTLVGSQVEVKGHFGERKGK